LLRHGGATTGHRAGKCELVGEGEERVADSLSLGLWICSLERRIVWKCFKKTRIYLYILLSVNRFWTGPLPEPNRTLFCKPLDLWSNGCDCLTISLVCTRACLCCFHTPSFVLTLDLDQWLRWYLTVIESEPLDSSDGPNSSSLSPFSFIIFLYCFTIFTTFFYFLHLFYLKSFL